MTTRSDLAEFHPTRLLQALEVVRSRHLHLDSVHDLPPTQLLDSVRRKLSETSTKNLEKLAFELSPKEMRAVLQLLALPEEEIVHNHAEIVLAKRPRKDLLRPAWNIVIRQFPVRRVEAVMRTLGPIYAWEQVGKGHEDRVRFERWFSRADLETGILSDFLDSNDRDIARWLTDRGVPTESNLHSGIWRVVLTRGNHELLMRLDHAELLGRARRETVVVQDAFALRYLERLVSPGEWQKIVLEDIRSRCGIPPAGEIQTAFWRKIQGPVREKFRRWAIERTLKEYFDSISDPHGRFEFWRSFLPHIKNAESHANLPVAFIDFGHFGVVEFPYKGNAAYVYPIEEFKRIKSVPAYNVNAYKDKTAIKQKIVNEIRGDRILHYEGWDIRYRSWIESLLGVRTGRRGRY